jgi:hypothetical protein
VNTEKLMQTGVPFFFRGFEYSLSKSYDKWCGIKVR